VRFGDLAGMALAALWRHKLRTLLSTLMVVFGSLFLAVSLALWQGVDETITREYKRHVDLRRIEVHPNYAPPAAAPDEPVEVRGTMSTARRKRLRGELRRRRQMGRRPEPAVELTPERLKALAAIEHVAAVRPVVYHYGRVSLGNRAEDAATMGVAPDDETVHDRLVGGDPLSNPDGREALVTEYLLYQLGIVNEKDVAGALGRTLRLEYRTGAGPGPRLLLTLLGRDGSNVTPAEERVLRQVVKRLPEALAKLDLPAADRADALALLRRKTAPPESREQAVAAELTLRGVLRAPSQEEMQRRGGWVYQQADVFLPAGTAAELLRRLPGGGRPAVSQAVVLVDHIDNVKPVQAEIKTMGLMANSAVEFIEREQFVYLITIKVMTLMAALALVVVGLGIVNIMLMSVLERVREIGVMKAVGARDRDVQAMFLCEGVLIGLAGGLAGLLLGWLVSFPADAWLRALVAQRLQLKLEESLFTYPWWLLAGVPLFACLVATLAALYPARRAVRVQPVEALRHE
jgi:putative ABC transport system permease protein